jgi:DNA mismatch repair protein MutL
MGNIVLLDELTINKIAAGEVIERPASVVKEMVENSIDAGATAITVEIKNGGISFIRITDNGKGIAKDDTEIAFERHATSKIRQASDIETIHSMGFRGEALASIAAVANVELITKTANDEIGTRLVVEAGKVLEHEEIGCKTGTSITVRNLFFNTPVRYKFLKKDFTESGYIEDAITRLALVNPNIAFKLINTGKTIIQTAGNGDIQAVIYGIYGKNIAENVLKVDYTYEDIHISGVIGKPEIARSNRSNQLFFVNNRYVKDKTLSGAIEKGFKGLLTIGKYAFSILNIEMDPSKVDVNVHPAKLEVRFSDESKIFKSVYHAVNDTLLKNDLIKNSDRGEEKNNLGTTSLFGNRSTIGAEINNNRFNSLLELQRKIKEDLEKSKQDINYNPFKKEEEEKEEINKTEETKTIVTTEPTEETTDVIIEPKVENTNNSVKTEEVVTEPKEDKKLDIKELEETSKEIDKQIENLTNNNIKEEEKKESFDEMYFKIFGTKPPKIEDDNQKQEPQAITKEDNTTLFDNIEDDYKYKQQYKFIGIVFNTYIIFEMDDEMYIMDQHAAHERIMFEKVKKNFYAEEEKDSQLMILPDIITLTHKEMDIAKENMELFRKAGFIIEEFGDNTIKISGTPSICLELNTRDLFLETLDEINSVSRTAKQEIENKFLATIACKAAVKAHMVLTKEEVESLMDELLKLTNPFTCPHGRPTVIKMSKYEIERKFERK